MALLQTYQAKALKQLYEGSSDPGLMQELRTATDLALRATKVTARSLGQTMSTLVVQERHLWLDLADMSESDKHRFLDSLISQAGLSGDALESFAQQFSVAQKRTEAVGHILPRRPAAVITPPPVAAPPPARRRGRPPAAPTLLQHGPSSSLHSGRSVELAAGKWRSPPLPLPGPWSARASGVPGTGKPETLGPALQELVSPLLPLVEGRVENPFFPLWVVPPLALRPVVPKLSEQFPMSPVPKGARTAVHGTQSPHSRPPLLSPVGSRVRSEDAMPSPAPPAQPWSQVSVALRSESGPCAPLRCPTAGTSVASLVPLVRSLGAWLALPRPSRWLMRTIRLGYAIQFARRPPKFRGVRFTSVLSKDAPLLRAEVAVLLAKDAIEPVPPAEMKSGFYSPYFIVPKKGGGLRPILDLRVLNWALHKIPFRMLTQRRIFQCIRPFDWFAAIDLKDAYFHVSILPRHRPFLRFAFEGRAYQYKVLPFGLSLSPRIFTKVVEAALVPLREAGIHVLNYLDDWLILAQSRALLCEHRDTVLGHLSRLGLRVNWEKSKLSPVQRISFLGMELDSVNLTARLSVERAQSMLNCLESFQRKRAVPLKHFQRLLGHMASAAAVTLLGLLHMRPLQHWLHDWVPRWAWRCGTYRVSVTPSCRQTFGPWSDLAFLRAGVPLVQVSRHVVVSTDASAMGWGAMCNGHAAAGLWTGSRLQWHVNCLELLAVWLALRRFKRLLHDKHVLVHTDNTATVAYINHQGGLRSRRLSQLARHLLLWSQKHLRSLRAVHIPGELNHAADELSRQPALPGEWQLHPEVVQLIWRRFGDAQVDLFASPDTSHCHLFYSLSEGTLGTDALAHSWPRGLRKYAFPPVSLLAQTLCKVREDEEQVLLVAPYWPNRTWFPELVLLATAPPWQIPLRRDLLSQRGGTLWHPRPYLWSLHVWSAANPVEVPPAPSAVRRGGAPDARSSTRVFAQGQPLCWARCPCVVIPLRVIPHVYSSTVRLPSRFPGRDLLPSLLCSYLTPGWLSLPQRLPYVVLPLASPYVYLHMVPPLQDGTHGTSFKQDVASVAFPYLEYAFPVLSIPTVRNSSDGHLCLSPVLSSIPTGVGGLAGFRRALEGVSNSGVFQGIPLVSHTDVTSNVTDW